MPEYVLDAFVMLVVVIDPVGVAPLFVALTRNLDEQYRRQVAFKAVSIAALILLIFTLASHLILSVLGISLDAFRIAGGILLFLLAMDMVFARQSGLRSTTTSEQIEASQREDISVFPLAIPLLAGPGAMTTLMILVGEANHDNTLLTFLAAITAAVLLLTLLAMLGAGKLMKLLGETGTNVISRVLGVLLAALAVQYVLDGLRQSLA